MKTITETIAALENANATIMLETATDPKMNKRNNPYYGRVKKHTAYIGISFDNYAEEVNTRRTEEGKDNGFIPKPSIYNRVNKYFVQKGEQLYIQFLFTKDCKIKTIWYVDDRPATTNEIDEFKAFMPQPKGNAAHQGLDTENEVKVRVVKLENIVAVGNDFETHTMAN